MNMTTVASISDPSAKEKVLVWADAAKFLGDRIQDPKSGSDPSVPMRKADMSMAAANALKAVLGQMEAAHRLMTNREMVANDITNPGNALKGGTVTQKGLTRLPSNNKAAVDDMLKALAGRLLGQDITTSPCPSPGSASVWADAAVFLSGRIQATADECQGRAPDMSKAAAVAMRTALAEIEASNRLMSNRETVVQDITNPGPGAVKGGGLTQKDLQRVDSSQKASVDKMIREVCGRVLGKTTSEPDNAQVWAQAATFFNSRIQSTSAECSGRKPDMSPAAAKAIRAVLASISSQSAPIDASSLEAAQMLMFNAERVVQDIANPGPKNIDGKALTQPELKRVSPNDRAAVDMMIGEVCCRLLGKSPANASEPCWRDAATYLSGRIQGKPDEMPGRNPDMSSGAATALRTVLKQL